MSYDVICEELICYLQYLCLGCRDDALTLSTREHRADIKVTVICVRPKKTKKRIEVYGP